MHKKIIFYIFLTFSHFIFAMDKGVVFGVESEIVPLTTNALAFDLVFFHYADHKSICSFAKTNKLYREYILKTSEQRKNYLSHKNKRICDNIGIIWHKNGSACCYAYQLNGLGEKLALCYAELLANDSKGFCLKTTIFENFIKPLPHRPAPFIDNKGMGHFYGYGRVIVDIGTACGIRTDVIRYSLDGKFICCRLGIKDDRYPFVLQGVIESPLFLKAILNTSGKIVRHQPDYCEADNKCLLFFLNDVIFTE